MASFDLSFLHCIYKLVGTYLKMVNINYFKHEVIIINIKTNISATSARLSTPPLARPLRKKRINNPSSFSLLRIRDRDVTSSSRFAPVAFHF